MVSKETREAYTATIGIECHVQLKTATKLFAGVGNDARDADPNTLVSHICFGLPGALPVLNKEAVHLGMRAAFALGTSPQKYSAFDRKHYFYPDLPLGYQITQFTHPIIRDGAVTIDVDGHEIKVGIHEAHLEADAGKSTHPDGGDYSLVDLNRAGTPLIEIVSEPDMHTPAEAKAYARELYLRMRYADVSDCNLFYGNMRFDVNVSVSKSGELGTRTETKNLNSFRSVEKAAEYEINRQIEQLEKGEEVAQETRGWNDAKQITFSQRSKENAHDYRYFPDPDIPPVELDDAHIEAVRGEMPVMPDEWRRRLSALGLERQAMETLLEADVELAEVSYLALIEEVIEQKDFAKALANWFVNLEIPLRRDGSQQLNAQMTNQGRLVAYRTAFELVKADKLSSSNAKTLLTKLLTGSEQVQDVEAFAKQHNLIQESDEGEIAKVVAKVLEENAKAAEDVKNGEMKAIGFLVGQVMKHSQGRANPQLAQELIKKQLGL
ncbi:MAG TPA: Asp-tRNA(Asn)/Glu-tRNA(Gln) amidotransferase subunit GatB [Candidatus Saccharimonadales bacterium]|nr:Asp-tRNA(Asn)/Glu-tRNA(Gln) amidotransferase subunit GatB [Candidatus Saccharimonadales bacterium]